MGLEPSHAADRHAFEIPEVERLVLTRIGRASLCWMERCDPWTNVYGVARSLLALGTASTLITNRTDTLFRPAVGVTSYPFCSGLSGASPFCLMPEGQLELVRLFSVVVLLVVASGWRPRLTALPHWWISFGLHASAIAVDGGDQVTAVLTLLLLPVALTDGRPWHWLGVARHSIPLESQASRLVALSALLLIRLHGNRFPQLAAV